MSKIYADTIETENSNVDITLGAAGDAVLIPTGATLKTNTIQDAGGNNIITSNGSGSLTVNSGLGGAVNLLTNNTFTNTEFATFTTLIDSTYDVYLFKYIEINPDTNDQVFNFQASTDGVQVTVLIKPQLSSEQSIMKMIQPLVLHIKQVKI